MAKTTTYIATFSDEVKTRGSHREYAGAFRVRLEDPTGRYPVHVTYGFSKTLDMARVAAEREAAPYRRAGAAYRVLDVEVVQAVAQ